LELEMNDRLLNEVEAAKMLRMSIAWMQWKRWKGGGPRFVKYDRAVRYRESDLLAWIEAHSGRVSTSSPARRNEGANV
jgi:predicted DNA-binding transcriptional regulator AlpA